MNTHFAMEGAPGARVRNDSLESSILLAISSKKILLSLKNLRKSYPFGVSPGVGPGAAGDFKIFYSMFD